MPETTGGAGTDRMNLLFDYIVVGKGLIGSAAARVLSGMAPRVAVVGPDEPEDQSRHDGVFASHYDQGRLTRLIARNPIYSKVSERAINNYPYLEEASGIRFHFPVGALTAITPDVPDGHVKSPIETARRLHREHTLYEMGDRSWRTKFPYIDFPDNYSVLFEPAPAGYVNPRDLLRAQLTIGEANGLTTIRETTVATRRSGDVIELRTAEGGAYRTKNLLVATGAFANAYDVLPRKLAVEPETEIVLLAEVSEADARERENVPTVMYLIDDPEIRDIYMTPPIRYPDGRFYVKLGANTVYDTHPLELEDIGDWFRKGDSDRCKPALERAVRSLWPGLRFLSFETKRCILTRTKSTYPMIDQVDDGLYVAVAGNGGAAKGSDAWGTIAAALVTEGTWPDELPRDLFRAEFA